MRNVLITGASGFCAQHLARRLAQQGDVRLVGLDVRSGPPCDVPLDTYLVTDISKAAELREVVTRTRPDMVFHLAALARGPATDLYRVNLLGGVHVLEAVREAVPQARVLLVGSAAEYGEVAEARMPITEEHPCRPIGPYGLSKYALTQAALDYVQAFGMNVAIVRPFNIVGAGIPPSLVVGAILERIQQATADGGDRTVTVGNLDTQRDFVAVEDAVDGYVRLMESDCWGEVFNICSGQPRSIRSIVEELISLAPCPIRLLVDPALVRPDDVPTVYGSWEKAKQAFGFRPSTNLSDALRAAWQHAIDKDN
jgi:GDP-4-dehydro-6-deoxy-D-mannose reductase